MKYQKFYDEFAKSISASKHWGYHLMINGDGCNKNINNEEFIRKFLKEIVSEKRDV